MCNNEKDVSGKGRAIVQTSSTADANIPNNANKATNPESSKHVKRMHHPPCARHAVVVEIAVHAQCQPRHAAIAGSGGCYIYTIAWSVPVPEAVTSNIFF